MLQKQPLRLYVRIAGEGMPQHDDFETQVYGLSPKSSDWPTGKKKEGELDQTFWLSDCSDFGVTIHAVTGDQLPALIGELDTLEATPTQEDAQWGYILMSRVLRADNIATAQAFFTQSLSARSVEERRAATGSSA